VKLEPYGYRWFRVGAADNALRSHGVLTSGARERGSLPQQEGPVGLWEAELRRRGWSRPAKETRFDG
jgi:hypothetical protein